MEEKIAYNKEFFMKAGKRKGFTSKESRLSEMIRKNKGKGKHRGR